MWTIRVTYAVAAAVDAEVCGSGDTSNEGEQSAENIDNQREDGVDGHGLLHGKVPNLQLACFYKKSFVGVLYNMSSNTSFGMNPSNHSSSAVSFTFKKSPGVRPVAVELT